MHIKHLKKLSRGNVEYLLDNLEYKLEKYQKLYYDRDDNHIVLSDPDYTLYYKCDEEYGINPDNIILKMPSYTGQPDKIYNKINKITNNFIRILHELSENMLYKELDSWHAIGNYN